MAIRAVHTFVSAQSDGGDATLVRPSNWNADHTLKLAGGGVLVGRVTAADGNAEEITLGEGLSFVGTALTVSASGVKVAEGCLTIIASADTVAPASGNYKLDTTPMAGRILPHVRDLSSGSTLQPHFGRNSVTQWAASGNSTAVSLFNCAALSVVGTVTAANWATTNRHTRMKRVDWLVTVAATTAIASFRAPANLWSMGSSPDHAGFHFVCQWAPATGMSNTSSRAFCGMSGIAAATAPTDVEPSTLANTIGMGWDAADANIQFMSRNGLGGLTKTATSIAVPTTDRPGPYEVMLFNPAGSGTVYWSITDLSTLTESTGSVSTNLPTDAIALGPRAYVSVGGVSSVVGITLMKCYVESDY